MLLQHLAFPDVRTSIHLPPTLLGGLSLVVPARARA
jgi:hypothetical protein